MDWFKWHHHTASDPKFRTVAKRSGQPVVVVLSVWAVMLETASMAQDRGRLQSWDDEDVACQLDLETEQVTAVREAMQGKTLDGDRLTGWENRNASQTGSDATERQRRKRARDKQKAGVSRDVTESHVTSRDVTGGHAMSRDVTHRVEESREEENTACLPRAGAHEDQAYFDIFDAAGIDIHRPRSVTQDQPQIQAWLQDGIPADLICQTIARKLADKIEHGEEAPFSLKFYDKPVREAHNGTASPKRNGKKHSTADGAGKPSWSGASARLTAQRRAAERDADRPV